MWLLNQRQSQVKHRSTVSCPGLLKIDKFTCQKFQTLVVTSKTHPSILQLSQQTQKNSLFPHPLRRLRFHIYQLTHIKSYISATSKLFWTKTDDNIYPFLFVYNSATTHNITNKSSASFHTLLLCTMFKFQSNNQHTADLRTATHGRTTLPYCKHIIFYTYQYILTKLKMKGKHI